MRTVLPPLLALTLTGCVVVAAEDGALRQAPVPSPPGAGGAETVSPSPEPSRPHYVPGKGWTTLKPYRDGDAVDPRTGEVWQGGPSGFTNPSTGGHIPGQ